MGDFIGGTLFLCDYGGAFVLGLVGLFIYMRTKQKDDE